ncbi:MAG TPA: hypothetical protein VFG49_05200 [Dyella sp.]|uniref:hypothetical protein n=1 Tax=Dyella sp. TaxID=1869338 RepID=UPI002D795FB8|nr:hypothetical protein [Dyella sp.]HET6552918.1 hypothetical protein [Dyella sp.]
MKQRRAIKQHAVFDHGGGSSPARRAGLLATLLQVAGFDGFGLWMLGGLALAVGAFPEGRGDVLVPLAMGAALAGVGLIAACLHSRWMPHWHGWVIRHGSWPTADALAALGTLLPVLALAGLVRGDNAFWATRLAGALLAVCSLGSLILTSHADARRRAPGMDVKLATQLPLSRVISAAYGGGLWLWLCVVGQDVDDANRHPTAWIVGLLMLALLRGLIENMRWQSVLVRADGAGARYELPPRRYLAALLGYAVPCLALLLSSYGGGQLMIAAVAAVSCLVGMGIELTLYDGALAALPP